MKKPRNDSQAKTQLQALNHLVSVGDATLRDFDLLGISSPQELAQCNARELYERLCQLKGNRVDPFCETIFEAAIAQAKKSYSGQNKKAVDRISPNPTM